jgi:nucleoside-diphosphate-sugar epimerase
MANAVNGPSVLIIGGLGYIGRFLALHIHKNNLASEVRLVDKVLPQLAWLAPEFAEACSQKKFMQADASRERGFYFLLQNVAWSMSNCGVDSVQTSSKIDEEVRTAWH